MSSPSEEFRKLAILYLCIHGSYSFAGSKTFVARLDRLSFLMVERSKDHLMVRWLPPFCMVYRTIWSDNFGGFQTKEWMRHLEPLRRALILERIADV